MTQGSETNWKNVNNWHWIERDCSDWGKTELRRLLECTPGVKSVKNLGGEISVNQRKGRLKQLWDLNIELELDDGSTVLVKDLMSDQSKEEIDCSLESFREPLWVAVEKFRTLVLEHQGKELLVQASNTPEGKATKLPEVEKRAGNSQALNGVIEENIDFQASVQDLYRALTEPSMIAAWTRSAPSALSTPGASFSLYNGAVTGVCRSLNPPYSLALDWRLASWPAGHHSSVLLRLECQSDRTRLVLKQTGVPKSEVESVRDNWKRFYWDPIKATFGYGAFL